MRGLAFGQSRVVCNVHWQSDVLEAGFVARLHADAAFRVDREAARIELAAVRARDSSRPATAAPKPRPWPCNRRRWRDGQAVRAGGPAEGFKG
jgi:hypothetical protein